MKILKTILKSLTLFFAGAAVTFAQTATPKTTPMATLAPAMTPSATKASSPAAETKLSTATTAPATTASTSTSAQPSAEEMKQMMELAKTNENHKMLAETAGTWNYVTKFWMDPKSPPTESKGTAIRKAVMDGRYVTGDYSGSFKMPGADGKMQTMNFKGMSMDAFDNVKKKFVSGWVDNMGTGIMTMDGTYDATTKTFTYTGEFEMMPGMKEKVRQAIKMADNDHMVMEYYENRGQGEVKTMEISYTRKK